MSAGEAWKLAGTVDYVASAVLGKKARAFTRPVRDWERQRSSKRYRLTEELRAALKVLRVFVADRSWQPIWCHGVAWRYALVFSDARGRAGDGGVDSIWGAEQLAAVVLTPAGGWYTHISAAARQVQVWLAGASPDHRINECEALAALLAVGTFGVLLKDADVLHFIDSTAAEGTLLKGLSVSRTLSAIASAFWVQAGLHRAAVWIGRVPSKLNVADGPTRHDLSEVTALGWARIPPWLPDPQPWSMLLAGSAQQ